MWSNVVLSQRERQGDMMSATVSLNTKIDIQEKRDFQANAEALGMTPSAAIKVFVRMFNQ